MKKIWAPWRSKFIYGKKKKGCIFCIAKGSKDDRKHFVLKRSNSSFAIMNIYPYNNGHIMVAPNRHKNSTKRLNKAELADLMLLTNEIIDALDKSLKPEGYNIGMNIGKAAGAGFPGHVHLHLIPRWAGDANFMTVCNDTRIVSDSLVSLYRRLKKCLN